MSSQTQKPPVWVGRSVGGALQARLAADAHRRIVAPLLGPLLLLLLLLRLLPAVLLLLGQWRLPPLLLLLLLQLGSPFACMVTQQHLKARAAKTMANTSVCLHTTLEPVRCGPCVQCNMSDASCVD